MKNFIVVGVLTNAVLLGSTALAAGWDVSVGGFFTSGVSFVNDEVSQDQPIKLISDAEVHVDPRLTLDNGLQVGVHVELEANNPDDGGNVDEYDMFVKFALGEVRIGANDGANDKFVKSVPCITYNCLDDGTFDTAGINTFEANGFDTSDAIKISYFSRTVAGFSGGVSYIPDNDSEDARISGDNDHNSVETGVQYANAFGDVSFYVSGGYVHDGAQDKNSYAVTGGVGFDGFDVGVAFASAFDSIDQELGAGITYGTGPWAVGAYYGICLEATGDEDCEAEDQWKGGAGVEYTIAQGIVTGAVFEFGDVQTPGSDTQLAGSLILDINF